MAKKRKKKPCSITFHLPKSDITLQFEYYEYISAASPNTKHKYIYFENSKDVISPAYEKWHQQVFSFTRKTKPKPCEATVQVFNEDRTATIKTFRITEVLPERSVIGPKDSSIPENKVIECVDYKYLEKIILTNIYEPPKVEVIEVEVEGGFAISGEGTDTYDDYEFGDRF